MNWESQKEHCTEKLENMELYKKIVHDNSLSKMILKIIILINIILISSCGMKLNVSMTGGNVDPRAKTCYVATFSNNATLVNPSLSQNFTNALKDRVQSQTPLSIVNSQNADYALEGEIITYSITPVAIQGNDVAAMNRLTIAVRVRFTNKFDETQNFEEVISRYSDYLSTLNFTSIESGLVTSINEAITEEVFNKAFVNW
jgi:hypothetical protein